MGRDWNVMVKSAPLRVAIVGLGEVARAHADALAAHPAMTLVAGVDRLVGPRRAFGDAWGCPTVPSVAALVGTTEVDAAIVCSPTATHGAVAGELLAAGADVLCEAPVALTSTEAGRLHEIARIGGRVLMAASPLRFVPDLMALRAQVRTGAIGRPVLYEITMCRRTRVEGTWRTEPHLAGGGVLYDLGPQAIEVLLEIADAPIRGIHAAFAPRTMAMDVEDTAALQLRTELGTLARIVLSWCYDAPDDTLVLVHGTEGTARVAADGVHVRRAGEATWTRSGSGFDEAVARRAELDAFLTCVRSGEHQRCCRTSLPVLKLIERAHATERTGRWSWRTTEPARAAQAL